MVNGLWNSKKKRQEEVERPLHVNYVKGYKVLSHVFTLEICDIFSEMMYLGSKSHLLHISRLILIINMKI